MSQNSINFDCRLIATRIALLCDDHDQEIMQKYFFLSRVWLYNRRCIIYIKKINKNTNKWVWSGCDRVIKIKLKFKVNKHFPSHYIVVNSKYFLLIIFQLFPVCDANWIGLLVNFFSTLLLMPCATFRPSLWLLKNVSRSMDCFLIWQVAPAINVLHYTFESVSRRETSNEGAHSWVSLWNSKTSRLILMEPLQFGI